MGLRHLVPMYSHARELSAPFLIVSNPGFFFQIGSLLFLDPYLRWAIRNSGTQKPGYSLNYLSPDNVKACGSKRRPQVENICF